MSYKKIPKIIGSDEWESFKNYAAASYNESILLALYSVGKTEADLMELFRANADTSPENIAEKHPIFTKETYKIILDKTASPLIFLWEEWQMLTVEQKMPYCTEKYKQRIMEIKRQADEAAEKAFGT